MEKIKRKHADFIEIDVSIVIFNDIIQLKRLQLEMSVKPHKRFNELAPFPPTYLM